MQDSHMYMPQSIYILSVKTAVFNKVIAVEYTWYRAGAENSKLTEAKQGWAEGIVIIGDYPSSQGIS